MTKFKIRSCAREQPDPHSFLDCCRPTSSAILTPQYIVIAAQNFELSSQEFNKVNTPFVLSRSCATACGRHVQLAVLGRCHFFIHRAVHGVVL